MMKKKHIQFLLFFAWLLPLSLAAEGSIFPPRPDPPGAVNDYAQLLSPQEVESLEQKLEEFTRRTSTAIVIAVIPDLHGFDPSDYAFRLAERWGVGQKGKNNGILILVKPKTATSKGEVFIAVGYGLEAVVPDAIAARIVRNEVLPRFREGDYGGGLQAAVDVLIALTQKEFTAEEYASRSGESNSAAGIVLALIVVLIIAFFSISSRFNRAKHYSVGKSGIPWWVWLMMANSGHRSNRGSWGSFSSGSGIFGGDGGGGGFGGFGGGSFGGGGAGGSW